MAENLDVPQPKYAFSIQCDVLPIMKLARWSAQAGDFLSEMHQLRMASPDFDRMCKRMLVGVCTPETFSSTELVAGALYVAECMLENFADAHGGDI